MECDVQRQSSPHLEAEGYLHRSCFSIGAVSVGVAGAYLDDVSLVPSLRPFHAESAFFDIDIQIERVDQLSSETRRPLFNSGSVWRLFEDPAGLRFDFSTPAFGERPYKRLFVDGSFRRAILQMSEECFVPGYSLAPLDYPLDELLIMHRLTQEKAIELHGSGIVRPDGSGNLFVGHSGAGKSTTTRLWTEREDVEVLSDDRIIVRRDELRSQPRIPLGVDGGAGKHEVLRLRDRSALPTGHCAQDDKNKGMRMYGTPWHGEAMFASPNSAPLARIFVLEHGHGNVLTPLSPSQAVAELFARSFVPFHRHEYVDSALQFLQEVADTVPVYRYSFEPDQRAVDKVLNFSD
jgi:hypothetical protein